MQIRSILVVSVDFHMRLMGRQVRYVCSFFENIILTNWMLESFFFCK